MTNDASGEPTGLRRTFQALSIPSYRLLWYGTLFSFLGMQMQVIARGYLAYDLTESNTALGGVMISFGVPQLLFSLLGGVVADRMAKRNVLILWQSMIALGSALTTLALWTDNIAYWMLIANGILTGTAFSFIGPARQAFIGDLVPEGVMGNAIVLQQANMNGTRVFGPSLAGVLIATPLVGMAGVYALTTVGFIIASVTMLKLPLGLPRAGRPVRSPWEDTMDGLRYVRRNRPAALLLTMSFLVVAIGFPYQGFLASVVRSEFDGGSLSLGILSSLAAVGALAATLWVAGLTGHRHAWRIQALAGIAFGGALAGFALSPAFVLACLMIVFVGGFASAFQSLNNAITMTLTDRAYYGRVQALMGLSWSLFGILSLPLGVVADAIGIRTTLALMGLASIGCIVLMQFLAQLWGVQRDTVSVVVDASRDPFAEPPPPQPSPAVRRGRV